MIKDFRYIYNVLQANFYLQEGLVPVEFGTNRGDVFFKFKDGEKLQHIFHKWMDRK